MVRDPRSSMHADWIPEDLVTLEKEMISNSSSLTISNPTIMLVTCSIYLYRFISKFTG